MAGLLLIPRFSLIEAYWTDTWMASLLVFPHILMISMMISVWGILLWSLYHALKYSLFAAGYEGINGRSSRLHAGCLFCSIRPRVVVSFADAAFTSVGIVVEVDLADDRCTSTVVRWSNG
jgi:hypothetical protein